jgi:hypothetical protein
MSTGFLKDMGLETIDATGTDWSIANGVYPATITDSKIMNPKNDTSKNLWQITYTLDPEVETYHGRTVSEFYDLNPELPSERRVWLKRRLLSIGVNDEQAATLEPADIIGTEVSVTVRNKNTNDKTYVNVTKVELRSNAGAGNPYVATF